MKIKKLKPQGIRILKVIHIISSFSWVIGCIALCLVVFVIFPQSGDELYIHSKALKIVDDYLVIAGVIATTLTGLVYAVWTNWGFFKHRWIVVKWIMTITQATFGGFVIGSAINENVIIAATLRDAAMTDPVFINNLQTIKIFVPVMAACMIFLVWVSVEKPWKKQKNENMAVANFSEAVEFRDHFKNEAQTKSQTSRRKTNKEKKL